MLFRSDFLDYELVLIDRQHLAESTNSPSEIGHSTQNILTNGLASLFLASSHLDPLKPWLCRKMMPAGYPITLSFPFAAPSMVNLIELKFDQKHLPNVFQVYLSPVDIQTTDSELTA